MAMRVGFTGTRKGMTAAQKDAVRGLLAALRPAECHHGDCVGADAQFHGLAEGAGALLVIHPPTDDSQRAVCRGNRLRPGKDHLARNRQIVDETGLLIVTPRGFQEELRSGTWACVRYARKAERPVHLVWPDGSVRAEGPAGESEGQP
jgi:hypothetical protein